MSAKNTSRSVAAAVFAALIALSALTYDRAAAHPAYQNLYSADARARPELLARCEICHEARGRVSDPGFLSGFGRAFAAAGNRITPEMRDRFQDIFLQRDEPAEEGGETIRFDTTQVAVSVVVSNARGAFIRGLDREAFTVLEDGTPQEILELQSDNAPLALAIIVDASGSALSKDLERWRGAISDIADRLYDNDVFALYTFGEEGIERRRDFAHPSGDVKSLFRSVRGSGESPLYDAILRAAEDLRARPERRRAILLFSDGSDSGSKATLREAEQGTFRAGIAIYAVDLINRGKVARNSAVRQAASQALETLAVETGGRYITPPDGFSIWGDRAKMKRVFSELIDELHSQYTIVYEPSNGRRSGRWRTIRVEMEQTDLAARTRLGYREGR
ncbi:MAG: VWA domain-containing protein [Acidobacteria bacterium]|nr:VWA domain-containing protein [Acidobacteriota bacterium]MCW5970619.1 VWA domain-containing protein [Blastocatellales bacterium]